MSGMMQALLMGGQSFKKFEMLFEGANGSTTFLETFGKTITRTGTPTISTAQFNEGTSSGLFPGGTGDYLSTATSTDFDFGSGDFAIEADIRPATTTGTHMIVTTRASAGSDPGFLFWQAATALRFICWGPTASTAIVDLNGGTLSTGVWSRVRVQRVGTAFNMMQAGVSVASATSSAAIVASTNPLEIGRDPSTNTRTFNGYMDRLQIFKGGIA